MMQLRREGVRGGAVALGGHLQGMHFGQGEYFYRAAWNADAV